MKQIILTDEQIGKLVSFLSGSTNSLEQGLASLFDVEEVGTESIALESLHRLDEQIFCCAQCGWWHDVSEESEIASGPHDMVCRECGGDD